MKSAPPPENESTRLAELHQYEILDTPPDEGLDNLVRLAAQICGTPIALVSLVDADRQWFKAKVGINVSETPRDLAFCAHAIHGNDVFVVSDAARDTRFADNPLVTADPKIRFYAGMPLVMPSGQAMGTLCVIDRTAKQLTEEQMNALRILGRQVVDRLELERSHATLKASEKTQADIIRAIEYGLEGVAFLNQDGCYTYMNQAHAAIYGYKPEELIGRSWKVLYEPEWIARIEQQFFPLLLNSGHWSGTIQGLTAVGTTIHVEISLVLAEQPHKSSRWIMCTCRDVTGRLLVQRALEASQKSLAQAQTLARVGSWEWDIETGTEIWSDEQFRIFGYAPRAITPTIETFREAIHPDDRVRVFTVVERALAENHPYEVTCRIVRPGGETRDLLCRGTVIRDPEGDPIRMTGTIQDITEQKTVEQLMTDTIHRLDLATKSGGIGIWDYYISENKLVWDKRMYALYGYTIEDFPGAYEAWTNRLHPDDKTQAEADLQWAVDGGPPFDTEFRLLLPDQSIRYIKASATLLRDKQGRATRMIGINYDITARKQTEEMVKASEERLSLAVEAAQVGIFEHQHQNDSLYWSPAFRAILGVSENAPASLTHYVDMIEPADRERVRVAIQQAHDPTGDGKFSIEHRIVTPNGEHRYVSLRSQTHFSGEGTARVLVRTVGTAMDITTRKQAEEQFRLVVESAPNGMLVANEAGLITMVNAKVEQWFGYERQELIGQKIETLLPERYRAQHPGQRTGFFHKPQARAMWAGRDLFGRRKDGSEFPLEIGLSPIQTAQGPQVLASIVDITARKQAEEQLKVAAQELASKNIKLLEANQIVVSATRAKSEFLATMSHEIRTPMNAIVGMAEVLQETPLTPDQANYVGRFSRAAASLMDLINSILDLSKIESGYMTLESIPFDLHRLADTIAELMSGKAVAKQLEFLVFVHPDVPPWVLGDPTRLNQVLVNLVGNAIKFTESGHVMIKIERADDPSSAQALRFSVSDTGIGIPPDKLRTIFEPFTQVDSSTTRKFGGTGLGLTISLQLVELMGGHLTVDSTLNAGSTFSFVIQLPQTSTPPTDAPTPLPNLQGRRILAVDDNDTNLMILREHLTRTGARIVEAASADSALKLLVEAHRLGEPFDLAILDYHMPVMDGLQLAEAIRARPELTTLPLVMHVSELQRDDAQRAQSLGITNYLYKPLSRQRLKDSLTAALNPSAPMARRDVGAQPEPALLKSCHILLVEDLEDNRDVISLFLNKTSYHLDMAENGAVAVQKFKTNRYDLVLMDMQMPVMDGLHATMVIREWERQQQRRPTPIVALTANAFKEEAEKSLSAGCTAHVTKPIKKKTLLTTITQYVTAAQDQAA